ncbi:MAG: hypothetical protein L0Z48_07195 [candidate division Zixibacteria bacterium]|nr:hypothetical protein [candidate division Zixibacteria bacterium]
MKRGYVISVLLALAVLATASLAMGQASVPNQINFQGRLADNAGNPVPDGVQNFTFRIFSVPAGGVALWTETIGTISTTNGLFDHQLGSATALPEALFQDFDELWLEIEANSEIQSPRIRLISTPYTRVANNLEVRSTALGSPDTVAIRTVPSNHQLSTYGSDGKEQVRIWGESYGEILLHDGDATNDLTVKLTANQTSGGELELNDTNGDLTIDLLGGISQISTYGSDGLEQFRLWGPSYGEILLHDADVTNDLTVRLTANGSSGGELELRSDNGTLAIDLHGGLTGDASVAVPVDAVNALEMFNEPGVASIASDANTPLGGSPQNLLSRSITVPASGYVFAIGTAGVSVTHTNGVLSNGQYGVSDVSATFPANQDVEVYVNPDAPSGLYGWPLTVHGLFSVSAGTHTFYFVGDEDAGGHIANDLQLSLLYFPTAYGTVTPTLAAGAQSSSNESGRLRTVLTTVDIAAEQAEAEKFNAERIARELAQVKADMEARMQKLEEQLQQSRQEIED